MQALTKPSRIANGPTMRWFEHHVAHQTQRPGHETQQEDENANDLVRVGEFGGDVVFDGHGDAGGEAKNGEQ